MILGRHLARANKLRQLGVGEYYSLLSSLDIFAMHWQWNLEMSSCLTS